MPSRCPSIPAAAGPTAPATPVLRQGLPVVPYDPPSPVNTAGGSNGNPLVREATCPPLAAPGRRLTFGKRDLTIRDEFDLVAIVVFEIRGVAVGSASKGVLISIYEPPAVLFGAIDQSIQGWGGFRRGRPGRLRPARRRSSGPSIRAGDARARCRWVPADSSGVPQKGMSSASQPRSTVAADLGGPSMFRSGVGVRLRQWVFHVAAAEGDHRPGVGGTEITGQG
jgi:hypothetical protein